MSIPSGITALIINIIYKIPFLVFLGGGDVPGFVPEIDSFHRIITPLRRFVLKKAINVIAVSDGLAQLSMKTDPIPVKTIKTGVNIDVFKPDNNQIKNDNLVRFLFTGRFAQQKNLMFLLDDFSILCKEFDNVHLTLIGDGPEKNNVLNKIKEKRIEKYITIIPWLTKTQIVQEYQKADCFINSSFIEGLSNSNIEAMSCGLAILASNVTGNNDLIQHGINGLLFSLNDQNELYKTMKSVMLDKNLLALLKQKSRETVCEKYTWRVSALLYEALLINEKKY
jgi:glycosyltransferase involved in cell wall biosynthesis